MTQAYPKPKIGDKRWYVYAHPQPGTAGGASCILLVEVDDVGRDVANVTVKKTIYSSTRPGASGETFDVPWNRWLPHSPFEAKKSFVRLRFTGELM